MPLPAPTSSTTFPLKNSSGLKKTLLSADATYFFKVVKDVLLPVVFLVVNDGLLPKVYFVEVFFYRAWLPTQSLRGVSMTFNLKSTGLSKLAFNLKSAGLSRIVFKMQSTGLSRGWPPT